MAPILRPYAPGVTPMLAISAASPGTGKSYLSYEVFNALYGAQSLTWTSNEEELRKLISTKLRESSGGAMVFDNVPGGYSVRSPVLAQLMTSESWEDRALGSNSSIVADNNRLWIINGNNIRTGEDMARRTLWVRLDANCPRPETRSIDGFKVGDLKAWLARGNAPRLLEALLTLAAGWIAAGAPREDHPLGGYSGWTSVMGGFLSWANIPGFLANREEEADGQDADAEMWIEVLTTWRERFGGQAKSVRSVMMDDEMASVLPKGRGGAPLESRELAWKFRSIMGRYYGDFRLVKAERAGSSKKPAEWRVESLT